MEKLAIDQIQALLLKLPQWTSDDQGLSKSFVFSSYREGVAFALKVALLAEKEGHHPDHLDIGWKTVTVKYVTHDAGGVTLKDFEAAQKISWEGF